MMRESMWKPRRVDFLAILIAAVIGVYYYGWDQSSKREAPATDWFAVRNISVPDFEEGTDPLIIYDRDIKKPFFASWSVELRGATASTNYAICTGSGNNLYKPGETLPEEGVKLSWFMGKVCPIEPGQYNLEVTYSLRPKGYPRKEYTATSNIFNVIPKGAQLYLDESQVEQLKKAQELLDNPKILDQLEP